MGIPRRSAGQSTTQLLAMKFLVLLFVAAAFAEPEADPEADPYLLYGGYYNGLHGGYYNGFSRYYNGLHPVYKTIVPATVEKTDEAVVEKSAAEPVKKVLSYPLHYPYGRLHYSTGYPAYTYGGYGYPYTYGAYRTPFTAFAPTAAAEKPAEERKKREADPEADADAYYGYAGYGYGHGVYGAYGYGGYPYHTGYAGYRYGYPYHTVKYVVKPAEAEAKSDEAVKEVKKVVPFSSYYYPHHFGYNYGRYYY